MEDAVLGNTLVAWLVVIKKDGDSLKKLRWEGQQRRGTVAKRLRYGYLYIKINEVLEHTYTLMERA